MGFVPFTFIDLIDILFVAYIMYWIYRTTKGTNAPYIISGIIVVYLLWVIVKTLNMELLSTILGHIISVGAIALIVVFQPEIRRFLQKIGMSQKRFNFISRIFNHGSKIAETNLQPLVVACREMSDTKTGALVVIGQQSDLSLITEGGICLDAKISSQLIHNIFFKNSPLHDGAVVIEGDRIVAARCILPVTQSDVPKSFGTRHRDRHERNFGRDHSGGLGGDRSDLDRQQRPHQPEHPLRPAGCCLAEIPDLQKVTRRSGLRRRGPSLPCVLPACGQEKCK